jgi:hypothetical protein
MNYHLCNVDSSFCIDLKIEFLGESINPKDLAHSLYEFIQCRYNHVEVQSAKNLCFFFFDLKGIDLVVCDLVLDSSNPDRIYFFIFGSYKHTGNSSRVDILDLHGLIEGPVVMIHKVDGKEKSLVMTMIAVHNFHHPIHHFCSQAGIDFL